MIATARRQEQGRVSGVNRDVAIEGTLVAERYCLPETVGWTAQKTSDRLTIPVT